MKKVLLVAVVSFLFANAENQFQLEAKARAQAANTCLNAFIVSGLFWSADSYQYLNKVNGVQIANKFLRFARNASPRALKIAALVAFPVLEYFDRKAKLEEGREEVVRLGQDYKKEILVAQSLDKKQEKELKKGLLGYFGI